MTSQSPRGLQARVAMLLRLWDDIRQVFRELPEPEQVPAMNLRWASNPPTRNLVPRLITRAAKQPIPAAERVRIMHGLSAWADAYTRLVDIASLPADQRPREMFSAATAALDQCASNVTLALASLRDPRRERDTGPAVPGAPGSERGHEAGPRPDREGKPSGRKETPRPPDPRQDRRDTQGPEMEPLRVHRRRTEPAAESRTGAGPRHGPSPAGRSGAR